jgi:ubiquinone biosynthesis accessory factor UbiK
LRTNGGRDLRGKASEYGHARLAAMQLPEFLEDLNRRMAEILAQSPAKDIERNLRAMLSASFSSLDLVTREEFDVQAQLLARSREKLAELEARLADLEKRGQ